MYVFLHVEIEIKNKSRRILMCTCLDVYYIIYFYE